MRVGIATDHGGFSQATRHVRRLEKVAVLKRT